MLREIEMIVAQRIVFVHAFKASSVVDGGHLCGHFIGVPPGIAGQKDPQGNRQKNKKTKPGPTTGALQSRSEKAAADDGKDRHPSPGELHEAQFGQEIPERQREPEHKERGCGAEQEQGAP